MAELESQETMSAMDTSTSDVPARICIIGMLGQDPSVLSAAESFQVPIVTSDSGNEFINDETHVTYFVMNEFEGACFDNLYQKKCRVLGPTALKELAENHEPLPPFDRSRPVYTFSMKGLVICFTGFKNRDKLCRLAKMVHSVGGSIRKEMDIKITHLVACFPRGEKYQYAVTFNIPVMAESWITTAWENRHLVGYSCKNSDVIAEHKLKFGNARVCFLGFSAEETEHMTQVLISNKGVVSSLDDPQCTHLVLEGNDSHELLRSNIHKPTISPCNLAFDVPDKENFHDSPKQSHSIDLVKSEEMTKLEKFLSDCEKEESKYGRSFFISFLKSDFWKKANERPKRILNLTKPGKNLENSNEYNLNKRRKIEEREKIIYRCNNELSEKEFGKKIDYVVYESPAKDFTVEPDCKRNKLVVDESTVLTLPENTPSKACIVKAEWFWASVQNEACADEKEYLFEDFAQSVFSPNQSRYQSTPMSGNASTKARKRKRLQKPVLNQYESPLTHKRRSSISDAGLLSISNSYLDCTPEKELADEVEGTSESGHFSARRQVFLELVQTESNYVNILKTIISLFKTPLEEMAEGENMLLNATEVKIIFGNLPPIYDIHSSMLEELKWGVQNWKEDFSIGKVILKYTPEMEKMYPAFINYFEKSKETLEQCDTTKPRFHAFLKIRQTKPECGRQSLKELLIRPVQRLPSISLLLNDLLKNTDKSNLDRSALEQALMCIKQAMTHINEDKRKTEAQLAMFDLFNEIDNCPAHLISSHRSLVAKCECFELTEILSSKKGDGLIFLLFTDTLEVCKKRAKTFNNFRSTKTSSLQKVNKFRKQYKHIRLMPLSNIRKVIDIKESEDCQNVFALMCRNNQTAKDDLCSFVITDESVDKRTFLKQICKQMAHTVCTPDPDDFYDIMEPNEINVDTSSNVSLRPAHSFSKALRFASKTGVKVGRALSMSKTPSKITRAVSTIRPFSAQGTLTPNANQLAQMRLQSCANLNELNCTPTRESPCPMSVQPTKRNMLTSAFSVSSLKFH